MKKNRLLVFVMLVVLSSMSVFAIDITSCTDITSDNSVYTLTQDIINETEWNGHYEYTCFWVTARNVTIDCAHYSISGNFSINTPAFELQNNSITILNCEISNVSTAINAQYPLIDLNVINNTIYDADISIALDGVNESIFENNEIDLGHENKNGIELKDSFANEFYENTFMNLDNTSHMAILVGENFSTASNGNIINGNYFVNVSLGIKVDKGNGNNISDNDFETDIQGQIREIELTSNSNINTVYGNVLSNNESVLDDGSGNVWNISTRGNNWTALDGVGFTCDDDSPVDGFCDDPVNIPGTADNYDHLPTEDSEDDDENELDITIVKTVLSSSVENGSKVTFMINVTNHENSINFTDYSISDEYNDTYLDFNDETTPLFDDYNETTNEITWWFDLNTSQSFIAYVNFTTTEAGSTTNEVFLFNDTDDEIAESSDSVTITSPTGPPTFFFKGTTYNGTTGDVLIGTNVTIEVWDIEEWILNKSYSNLSNAQGDFTVSFDDTIYSPSKYMYKPVIVHYNANGVDADYTNKPTEELPGEMLNHSAIGNVSFYLKEAATLNITADDQGNPVIFNYVVKDADTGVYIAEDFDNYVTQATVHVIKDRSYSVMIFPNESMPQAQEISNPNAHEDIEFNITNTMTWISGDVFNTTDEADFDNLMIIPYILEPGNTVFDQAILLYNMSQWRQSGHNSDFYDASTGFYNITIPGSSIGTDILLFAIANDGTLGGYRNITIDSSGQSIDNIDFNITDLLGSPKIVSMTDASSDEVHNFSVNQVNFSIINSSGDAISGAAGVEADVESNFINFTWFNDIAEEDNGTFQLPVLAGYAVEMTTYTSQYAPKSDYFDPSQLVDGIQNISLASFQPRDIAGSLDFSEIFIDLIISNESCTEPNYNPDDCSLTGLQTMDNFNILSSVIGGGDISFIMGRQSNKMGIMYINVDLIASGPPDVLFDSDPSTEYSGGNLEELWRFGSDGPEIYDEILMRIPFNTSFDADTINVTIEYLYDDDWGIDWNVSSDGTDPCSGGLEDYCDYNTSWFSGMPCSTSNVNANCYVDTTYNFTYLRVPHFSSFGSNIQGELQTQEESYENATITKTNLNVTVVNGSIVEFVINVTNTGTVNLTNYTIYDEFNTTYLEFDNASGNYDASQGDDMVEWIINLTIDESQLFKINFTAIAAGITNNSVEFQNASEQTIAADKASVTILLGEESYENATITKTAIESYVENGSIAQFLINVTNTGTLNLTDYTITDRFNNSYINYTGSNYTTDYIDWTGDLSWTFNLTSENSFIILVNFTGIGIGITNNTAELENQSEVIATDKASVTILLGEDTENPVVTLISPANEADLSTSQIDLVFNVTDNVAGNANCTLYLNNQINESMLAVINAPTQNFSFANLADNHYEWYVNCSDGTNNTNSSNSSEFSIDTIAPVLNYETGPSSVNQGDSITIFTDWNYNEAGLSSGVIYVNNVAQETNNSPDNGGDESSTGNVTLSYTTNSSQAGSNLSIYVSVNDTNDRWSNSSVFNVQVNDTEDPIVTLISPANEADIPASQIDLVFNVTDNVAGNANCTLYLNNQKNLSMLAVINAPTQNFSFANLADNYYEWYVNCSDGFDNINVSNSSEFSIDTIAPVLNYETGPSSVNQGDFITIFTDWNYNEAGLSSGVIYVNNVAQETNNSPDNGGDESSTGNVTLSYTTNSSQAGSNLSIYVSVNDTNDRWSNSSVFNVQVNDTENPIVTLISPANESAQITSTIDFIYNVTDNVAGNITCTLYLEYEVNESRETIVNAQTQNFSSLNIPDDYYDWYVNCSDDAGNHDVSNVFSFEKDSLAPILESNVTPDSVNQGDTITIFTSWNYGEAVLSSGFMYINDVLVDTNLTPSNGGDESETGNVTLSYITNSSQAGSSLSINISINDTNNRLSYELFNVTVNDTEAPVITLIGNNPQIIEVDTSYNELNATANDNGDGNLTTSIIIDSSEVDTGTLGDYIVYYNVTDAAGNSDSKTRNVTIQDTTNPTWIEIPQNQDVEYDSVLTLDVNATDNVAIDTYSINDTTNFDINAVGYLINKTTLNIGTYSLLISVNDTSGNTNTSTITITVSDSINPTWIEIPQNQNVEYDAVFILDVNATDAQTITYYINDTTNFAITSNTGIITNNTKLNVGTYELQINATDVSSNINSTIISVTVEDTTLPYFTSLPSDQTINYSQPFALQINGADNYLVSGYQVNDTNFKINSSGYLQNKTQLAVGKYGIEVIVNDTSGNENSSSFVLSVQEIIEINVTANTSTIIESNGTDTNITLNLGGNVSTTLTMGVGTTNSTGTTLSLLSFKGIEIEPDSSTEGNLTWAYIQIFYNDTEISNAGIEESTLKMYYYNNTANDWQEIIPSGVNQVANYIWANTTHFSTYAAFGSATTTSTPGGSNTGGSSGGSDDEVEDGICKEEWMCGSWNDCVNGEKSRVCYEVGGCGTSDNKPMLSTTCEMEIVEEPIEKDKEKPVEDKTIPKESEEPKQVVEDKPIWPQILSIAIVIALFAIIIIVVRKSKQF